MPEERGCQARPMAEGCSSSQRYAQEDLLTALTGNGNWDVGQHWAKAFLPSWINRGRSSSSAPGPGFAQAEQLPLVLSLVLQMQTVQSGFSQLSYKRQIGLSCRKAELKAWDCSRHTVKNSVWGTCLVEAETHIQTCWRNKILALQLAPIEPYPLGSFCTCVLKAMHTFDWKGFFKVTNLLNNDSSPHSSLFDISFSGTVFHFPVWCSVSVICLI